MSEKQQVKLSQSAPILRPETGEFKKKTFGVPTPVSASTIPSVYNKKLSKLFRGRLVILPGDFIVEDALRRMGKYNISSVPVTKSRKDNTILGFVGTLDFLAYLFNLLGENFEEGQFNNDKEKLKEKMDVFKKTMISELVDTSGRNPFKLINGEESLSEAVDEYLKGVHRIAITDEDGQVTGVISQWTIANYLATVPTDDKEWIPSLRAFVGDSKFTKDLVTANNSDNTLNCFFKMYKNNLTAIPILNENGKLWGNLSASDLRCFHLLSDNFYDLLQPVSQFLACIRKQQGRPENYIVSVSPKTPVKDIVAKFNEDIIHRVYLVDNENNLLGAFSLTDLMKDLICDTHTTATYAKPTQLQSD
jgi:CBS domain-containing protein